MAKAVIPTLPKLMHSYFHEWLAQQRNASHRTVMAYRDAWRLFLRFVSTRQQKKVAALVLENLTGAEVIAFLQYVEQEQKATIPDKKLPTGGHPEFLFVRRRPRAPRSAALRRGVEGAFQKSAAAGDLLPGINRGRCAPLAA